MYTLDLDRLNLRSPYYVWKVKDGVYAFDTDYEVSYEIGLSVNGSISVPQATVCKSIVSTCSFAGSILTSTATSTRYVPLRT